MKRSPRSAEGAIKGNRSGGSRWRLKQAWDARKARKRVEREKVSGWAAGGTVVCPRCRREVRDIERARTAHRQGCVTIPRNRPAGWGVKTRR